MSRLALLPNRRNPMRPVVMILAVFFGAMLVGFPILMLAVGLGTGSTIGVTLLIVAVALFCLGIVLALARSYDRGQEALFAGEAWARWTVTPEEHRRFVGQEQGRAWKKAAAYALGGTALGATFGILGDWLTGSIMIGVFLLATFVIIWAGGPPRGSGDEAHEVRVGPRGIFALGRYLPLEATGTRPRSVRLEEGDPAALLFAVSAGSRLEAFRVPVPRERLTEAEALVARFQREVIGA